MECASEVCRAPLQQVRGVNSDPGNGIQGGFAVAETLTSVRVALITGANQGIGFEIARQLGKQGILVIASARDKQKGLAAAETLQREGLQVHSLVLDVTVQSTIDAAVAEVDRKFGKLDILMNNAG